MFFDKKLLHLAEVPGSLVKRKGALLKPNGTTSARAFVTSKGTIGSEKTLAPPVKYVRHISTCHDRTINLEGKQQMPLQANGSFPTAVAFRLFAPVQIFGFSRLHFQPQGPLYMGFHHLGTSVFGILRIRNLMM